MTFSIVGRSPDGSQLGVAVASKFLAVGAFVPAAACGAGGVATQSYVNLTLRTDGLRLLADGRSAEQMLGDLLDNDPQREQRQAGVVDAAGRTATFTGSGCGPWAGGTSGSPTVGAYAAQGNMLAGPEVVEAMVSSWLTSSAASTPHAPLAPRLLEALAAGEAAGGDPRGRQSAALLVVSPGSGYGGLSDVAVDLRSDDHPAPIDELARMLTLHELYFGTTPEQDLLALDGTLADEVRERVTLSGFSRGDVVRDLYDWMGRENLEERWHDGRIDPVVLEQLRLAT